MTSRLETLSLPEYIKRQRENLNNLLFKDTDLANKKVLDIGSGYGKFGSFVRSLGVGCELVDIDSCNWTLPQDSTAIRGNAYRLPFQDGAFDIVISLGCIPILCAGDKLTGIDQARKNTKRALEESFRVTKPGERIHMYWVPTVDTLQREGLYDWEYYGQKAVAEVVIDYINLLNSKDQEAKIRGNTLVICKKN